MGLYATLGLTSRRNVATLRYLTEYYTEKATKARHRQERQKQRHIQNHQQRQIQTASEQHDKPVHQTSDAPHTTCMLATPCNTMCLSGQVPFNTSMASGHCNFMHCNCNCMATICPLARTHSSIPA